MIHRPSSLVNINKKRNRGDRLKSKKDEHLQNTENGESIREKELKELLALVDWELVRRKNDMEALFTWKLKLNQTKKYAKRIYEFFNNKNIPSEEKYDVVNANIERAEKIFKRLVAIYPENEEIHRFFTFTLFCQDKEDELMVEYKRAIEVTPPAPDMLNNFALMLQENGEYEDAERYYKQSLELESDNPYIWNNLGSLYEKLKRYNEAYQAFKRAHELEPGEEEFKISLKRLRRELRSE